MLTFKKPEISDKAWIDEILKPDDLRNADICFTNIFLWCDGIGAAIARAGDRIILRAGEGDSCRYSFPSGKGDLRPAIEAVFEDALSLGACPCMRGVPTKYVDTINELYGGKYDLIPETEAYDYVYSAQLLAEPKGKKLHSKKNHINRFIAEHEDWTFEPITAENLHECREMADEWMRRNHEKIEGSYLNEEIALEKMFGNFEALGLEGGLLRTGGKVVGFTIGEVINSDTFVTHFEKAYADINGAYPMVNREFARQIIKNHPEIVYINREEDMGLEYLRKAKQSYCPEFMVEKFIVKWKKECF